ncbi:MAG: XrtA-associated tyrosine autokinase [Rhodoferax sp.]|nr:XrtA-associated tyrosine autokinase [Rhodoferax sp.]
MSSLIEQATLRLEQLRRAGVAMPVKEAPVAVSPVAELVAAAPMNAAPSPTVAEAPAPKPVQVSKRVEIDLEALAIAGIVSPNAPRSRIADQYRVIKRPLIGNAMGKGATLIENGNLIMVTSSVPGEGKSFTAINLAISIAAELDNTVMLVDADVARPSVLRVLGLSPGPGLLDLLVDGSADLSSMLLRTNIDKLSILPSGTPHERATEMLASDAMTRLLADMGKRYSDRIIIFDSPPLLLTTEARVLATHMGQIVMVIHAEKTLRSDVQDALATIEACPVKLMLLNQARTNASGGYGYGYGQGYGQGYGYGYGYGYGNKAAP